MTTSHPQTTRTDFHPTREDDERARGAPHGSLVREAWYLLKQTYACWDAHDAFRLAAALSYYTVFSIAPVLVIVVAIVGAVVGKSTVEAEILARVSDALGPKGADLLRQAIAQASQPKSSLVASVIGVGTLLIGATAAFSELQNALDKVWGVKPGATTGFKHFVRVRVVSFAMVLVIGGLLFLSLVSSAAIGFLANHVVGGVPGSGVALQIIEPLVSLAIGVLLFAAIFRILPDVQVPWKDVWIGALVTSILFTLGKWLVGKYLGTSGVASSYGAAGSLAALLAWVYYSALIFYFGAEFTHVFSTTYGSNCPESTRQRIASARTSAAI